MKNDSKNLNKLIAYARDNLLLDALDETYTLNRLAKLYGVPAPELDPDCECDLSLDELIGAPGANVDAADVLDAILPLPHTVNGYFRDELSRNAAKAFDFLFETYALGGCVAAAEAGNSNGFINYAQKPTVLSRAVLLPIGGDELYYTPRVTGNHIATVSSDDFMTDDIVARESAYVAAYGGTIAKRIGDDATYYCCDETALDGAAVKEQLKSGTVKIALLDYPVPVIAVSGVAKNTVAREAAKLIKAAGDAEIPCIAACTAKNGVTFYLILANDIASTDTLKAATPLTACGVFETIDCTRLLSVLEKGTALSTDLFAFKPIYSEIGGVKHGAKAKSALDGALAAMFKPALAASAATDEAKAKALVAQYDKAETL